MLSNLRGTHRGQSSGVGGGGGSSSPARGRGALGRASPSSTSPRSPVVTGGRTALARLDTNRDHSMGPPQKKTRVDPQYIATKQKAMAVCKTAGNDESELYSDLLDPQTGALWDYATFLVNKRGYFFSAAVENPPANLLKDIKRVYAKELQEFKNELLPEDLAKKMAAIAEFVSLPSNNAVVVAVHDRLLGITNSMGFEVRCRAKEWFNKLHPQGFFIPTTKRRGKGDNAIVEKYEPGEREVYPMHLGLDGAVTEEWIKDYSRESSILKKTMRAVTNPEDFCLFDFAVTTMPEDPRRDPKDQLWIVRLMNFLDMKLLYEDRFPYPVSFPLAEFIRYVCSFYPAYSDTFMSKEAVPFVAFIMTQLCALLDNPYMSATPYRGMKTRFAPYFHARNMAITLTDEVTSPDLMKVVKKALEAIRPTTRVKRYSAVLRPASSDDDETMDEISAETAERELNDHARQIGADEESPDY